MDENYEWPKFYMEFADKLLEYKNKRDILIGKIMPIFSKVGANSVKLEEKGGKKVIPEDIDPFTIIAIFTRKFPQRVDFIKEIKKEFSITSQAPADFIGVPVAMRKLSYYKYFDERGENDINNLWDFFEIALEFSKNPSDNLREDFIKHYDIIYEQGEAKKKLTTGLFWIRPFYYISLDDPNKKLLKRDELFSSLRIKESTPMGNNYLEICDCCKKIIESSEKYSNLIDLSYKAYSFDDVPKNDENVEDTKGVLTNSLNDFLKEVYITEKEYIDLKYLIETKKNIIIQGPPGVGKTFISKRLAYSIMGEQDNDCIKMIQFHQSYSYEDFVKGYRPSKEGFELKNGPFYDFCKTADKKRGKKYFFIIDEINRGDISKIFGELFLLIENDKRGEENKLNLLYECENDEPFYVPDNIYIIGLMNTADRSIAMFDYALRRRFVFFDLKPGFDSEGFRIYQESLNSSKFDRLVKVIKDLNREIYKDGSLGEGFCIGHSYLCSLKPENVDEKLHYIVEYELIPLLKEYWFDEPDNVKDWSLKLRSVINDSS